MNTGGGYVFDRMKAEFCAGPSMPLHCFCNELAETGGAWLDAPDYFPAGGMRSFQLYPGAKQDTCFQLVARRY